MGKCINDPAGIRLSAHTHTLNLYDVSLFFYFLSAWCLHFYDRPFIMHGRFGRHARSTGGRGGGRRGHGRRGGHRSGRTGRQNATERTSNASRSDSAPARQSSTTDNPGGDDRGRNIAPIEPQPSPTAAHVIDASPPRRKSQPPTSPRCDGQRMSQDEGSDDESAVIDVKDVIARATPDVKRQGVDAAERRVQWLDAAALNANPQTKDLLAFMHMVMLSQSFVKQGRSYIKYMNSLTARHNNSDGEHKQKRDELRRSVNVALGRPVDENFASPGDLFIREAYDKGYGWSLSDNQNCSSNTFDNFCGFDMDFMLEMYCRASFSSDKIADTGGSDTDSLLRIQRDNLLSGTAIVVTMACIRDVLHDNSALMQSFTARPVGKSVALLLAGIYMPNTMSGTKGITKEVIEHLGKPRVEVLPRFEEFRRRVRLMIDCRKERPKLTDGSLTVHDALTWYRLETGASVSSNKRQRSSSHDGDDEEGNGHDTQESIDRTSPILDSDPDPFEYKYKDITDEEYDEPRDDGALLYFQRLFETTYIDGTPIPPDVADAVRPKPKRIALKGGYMMQDNSTPELLLLTNAFSPGTVKSIITMYQRYGLPFINEDTKAFRPFVLDKAENENGRASFQIGKDAAARFLKSFDAHRYERILTVLLESQVRAALKHKLGKEFEIVFNCGGVNVCLLQYRKGFAFHYDHDPFNTFLSRKQADSSSSSDSSSDSSDDSSSTDSSSDDSSSGDSWYNEDLLTSHHDDGHKAPLPTPRTMVIVTVVFSGPLGSVTPDKTNYKLDWRLTEGGKTVFGAETGHNDVHIQIGLDNCCQHGGEAIRLSFRNNCWRLTITLRGYCNPTVNYNAWKARSDLFHLGSDTVLLGDNPKDIIHNVLEAYESPHLTAMSTKLVSGRKTPRNGTEHRQRKLSKKSSVKLPVELLLSHESNQDVYANCPWSDIPEANKAKLSKVPPILQQRQPIPQLYLSWPMQQIFLRNRIIIRVLIYNHDIKDKRKAGIPIESQAIPMWETGSGSLTLPTAMTYYSSGAMQLATNVAHSDRSKPIVCNEHPLACTSIILTCLNRIDHDSARSVLKGILHEFFVYGSGGAPHAPGQAGPEVKKSYTSETGSWAYPASPQDIDSNKINHVLYRAAENCQLVSVWMGPKVVMGLIGDEVAHIERNQYLHVGRFYCYGEETREGQTSAMTAIDKEEDGLNDYVSFRLRSHKIFRFRRIDEKVFKGLDPKNEEFGELSDEDRDWRVETITDRQGEFADLRLPLDKESIARHLGVGDDFLKGAVTTQLEYHYDQHAAPIRSILPKTDSMPIIAENDPDKRPDCEAWIMQRNKKREENPFSVPLDKRKKMRSKKNAIVEWRTLTQAMTVCCFMRILRMSLTKSGNSVPLSDVRLGTINRQFSFPCPWRDHDVPPLLYALLLFNGFRPETPGAEDKMGENLLAAIVCHLYGRPGFIGNYFKSFGDDDAKECLRKKHLDKLIKHLLAAVSDSRVSLSRCVVQQYENQIPAPLRTSIDAAVHFLETLGTKLDDIVKTALRTGRRFRREYVTSLADVMASIIPSVAAPRFYFLAQHIIATLALSYPPGRFGAIRMRDVHMGPGSRQAITNLGLKKARPELSRAKRSDPFDPMSNYLHDDECTLIIDRLKELGSVELEAMGLMQRDGELRVRLTGREVSCLDIEHMLCKLYLYLNKKSPPGLQAVEPNYHLCQCHPARFNAKGLELSEVVGFDGRSMSDIAKEAISAFDKLKDFSLPWKLLFTDEWGDMPDFDAVPVVDPVLQANQDDNDEDYIPESDFVAAEEGADEHGFGCYIIGPNVYHTDRRNENSN